MTVSIQSKYDAAVKAHAAIATKSYDEGFSDWDALDLASANVRKLERQLPSTNNANSIAVFLR